jgi:hypothetical protein
MKLAPLMLLSVAAASPVLADPSRADHYSGLPALGQSWTITCETVRAYVSQVGLAQARAMARANGMTAAQEWMASRCLATPAASHHQGLPRYDPSRYAQ